jgi:apolipoprotein N-acyltransferase
MSSRSRSGLRTIPAAAGAGGLLGLALIAPALGFADAGPGLAWTRLLGGLILLAVLFRLWSSLRGSWASLLGGFAAGLGFFGVALHWLGSSANPDPGSFVLREAVTAAGAMWLFVPWWALWWWAAHGLTRFAGRSAMAPLAFVTAFGGSNLLLGDLAWGIPMAPLTLLTLDTLLAGLLPLIGQFGVDTVLVALGTALGHSVRPDRAGWLAGGLLTSAGATAAAQLLTPTIPDAAPPGAPTVHLVQPALPHVALLPPETGHEIVHGAVLMGIEQGMEAGATLVVLPEGAVLNDLTAEDGLVREIAARLPEGATVLVGFRRAEARVGADGGFTVTPFNSVMLIEPGGAVATHDKAHLVPFGETMPGLLFALGFDVIAGPPGGFGAGPAIGVFEGVAELPPFALAICYEAVLTGAVSREAQGAKWVLNLSAETLFRGTIGPRLLLDHMRLRAIETGRPMLRATAHAYSGVIAADGTVVELFGAEEAGGLTVAVPPARQTIFWRHGYAPLHGALGIALGALLVTGFGSRVRDRLAGVRSNL